MSTTVDLVIVAGDSTAIAAAIDAVRRGMRVLVVTGPGRLPLIRCLRRALRAAGTRAQRRVIVFSNAEVVCVDGVDRIEAVVVRRMGTGRLIGVNACAVQVFGAQGCVTTERLTRRASTAPAPIHAARRG